jgi:hypothetical protein
MNMILKYYILWNSCGEEGNVPLLSSTNNTSRNLLIHLRAASSHSSWIKFFLLDSEEYSVFIHHYKPYSLRVLSMLVEAIYWAWRPNLTPVAIAVWSLNTFNSCHCLHRYTLKNINIINNVKNQERLRIIHTKKIMWPESASGLYRPSDRRLSAKLVPIFVDRGCHMASVTDPYGRTLGFLDRSRYFFFKVAPQLYSRGWVDPVPNPLLLRECRSARNWIRASGSVATNSVTRGYFVVPYLFSLKTWGNARYAPSLHIFNSLILWTEMLL